MALTVYGTSRSRGFRVLWMLEELGLPYVHEPIGVAHCAGDPAYLAVNPAGTIPCISDDSFVLTESLAINLHLARRHGKLWPASPLLQSTALQWSFWAATALEEPYTAWATHAHWLPPQRREPAALAAAAKALVRPLARLAHQLARSEYLLGSDFTVADLNVAGVIALLRREESLCGPVVAAWLGRCQARPAYSAAARLP